MPDSPSVSYCGQPDPTRSGAPCDQSAAYEVRLAGYHGVPGERVERVCADHLAWWREAFPEAVLSARTLTENEHRGNR